MPESSKLSPIQIHKQRICSQAQLGKEAQALPTEGAPPSKEDLVGVVCTCLKYLRKKVDAPFGRKSIRTLPKFGYKIMDEGA